MPMVVSEWWHVCPVQAKAVIKAVNRGGSDNNLYKDYRENYIDIVYRAYMILLVFEWWHVTYSCMKQ